MRGKMFRPLTDRNALATAEPPPPKMGYGPIWSNAARIIVI
jgi:hypothetical protein